MRFISLPMIPASHSFRQHQFGAHAPWMDLANSEMWNGYGSKTDFLEEAQWIADFLEFWNFDAPQPGPAVRKDLRELRSMIRGLSERLSRGLPIRSEDVNSLNAWLKVPVVPRL